MDNIFTFFPGYVTKTPAFCLFKLDHDRPRSPGTTVVIVRAASERLTYIQRKCVGRCNKPNNLFWSETLTRTKALLRHALAGQGETTPTIPTLQQMSCPRSHHPIFRPRAHPSSPRHGALPPPGGHHHRRCMCVSPCHVHRPKESAPTRAVSLRGNTHSQAAPSLQLARFPLPRIPSWSRGGAMETRGIHILLEAHESSARNDAHNPKFGL